MNIDTLSIKSIKESANLTAQQNIDADIILPDYYDTIGKILKSELKPVVEAITSSGDKISIAGIAKFTLHYLGEDNKMYCYENEYRYTKVFQSQFAESCISTRASQTVFSLNCRAIAPKRIELRAVLQVGIKIKAENNSMLISEIDDSSVISRSDTLSFISAVNSVSRTFSLSSSFPLNDYNDNIDIIIRKDSRIKIQEIKTIHNKAYIKGIAETEILYYSNSSGNTSATVLSLPLSEIIDIFGAEEDDICNVIINDVYTEIIIKNNDAENQSLDIRIDINLQADVSRNITGNILADVYSIKNEIYTEKDTVELITSSKKVSKTENIVFETDIYDESKLSVMDCWVSNIKISSEKHGNRYNFLTTAAFNALIKNEYGNFSIISREHTFESELIAENSENAADIIDCQVLSIQALQTQGGKIRFTSELLFSTDIHTIRKVTGFTNVTVNEEARCENSAKFIIYFAKENEVIWDVAKENKTTVDAIKQLNSISGDILTEDKMLVLPSF